MDTSDRALKKQRKRARLRSYGGEKFEITVKSKQDDEKNSDFKMRDEDNISVPNLEA